MASGEDDIEIPEKKESFEEFGDEKPPSPDEGIPEKGSSFQEEASDRERISSLATSMRIVEERYGTLRKKLRMTDDELIDAQQEFERERKVLDEQIVECKERITKLEEQVEEMKEEIRKAVHQRDLRYLKKYVEYWNPSQFITRDEAESMLGSTRTQNV